MSLLLRSGAVIFLGGGGACVIPFIKFPSPEGTTPVASTIGHSSRERHSPQQTNSVSTSSPSGGLVAKSTFPIEEVRREEKNCSLKVAKDEVTSKLSDSPRFVTFSCDNSGKDDLEINSKWTVWLPVTFLKNQGEDWLVEGQKIEIKTNTSHIGEDSDYSSDTEFYRTTFESESFVNKKITGEWGKHYFEYGWEEVTDDAYIWKVKITDPETDQKFIYLRR